MSNVDMRVTLAGMTMKNRWWWPPGTFGFGREYSQFLISASWAASAPRG